MFINNPGHMTKMACTLGTRVLQCIINHDLKMTLINIMAIQNRSPMYLNGEIVKMSIDGKNLLEMGRWTDDTRF